MHGLVDGREEEGDENEESEKRAKNSEDELKRSATNHAAVEKRLGPLIQVMSGPLKYS